MIPKWKIDNTENITFFKKNFQVDYFKNDLYKNIIYSKQQIILQMKKDMKIQRRYCPIFIYISCCQYK